MEPVLGVGIVGCGYWGINYVRVFSELPNSQVVAVCDLSEERLGRVRQRFPSAEVSLDLRSLLRDPRIDAIIVATPLSAHHEVVKECLLGRKHVLVEKPFVTKVSEGEELIELAAQHGRVLMVGHTFMYNPGIRKMKECLSEGGEIYYLHATRTNLGPIRKDANAIWDLASHDVSIFGYLLDLKPLWVSAVAAKSLRNGKEDVGFITLAYPNGILGHIHASWLNPDKVREVVAVGSQRRVVFNDLDNLERIRIYEKGVSPLRLEANGYGEFQLSIRDGDIISPKVETSEPLKNQCTHFLDCIAGRTKPMSDGVNGLDVVKVLVAIDESVRRNGAPVEVLP